MLESASVESVDHLNLCFLKSFSLSAARAKMFMYLRALNRTSSSAPMSMPEGNFPSRKLNCWVVYPYLFGSAASVYLAEHSKLDC